MNVVVFQLAEYGPLVSAAPRSVHVPAPAGDVWNCAEATPVPASAESEVTLTVPLTSAPLAGAVTEPVGSVVSMMVALLSLPVDVQLAKIAVTRQTKVPSPGASEHASDAVGADALVPHASVQTDPDVSRRSTQ